MIKRYVQLGRRLYNDSKYCSNDRSYITKTRCNYEDQIEKLCEEAKTYTFASVCVNPTWVNVSAKLLQGTAVKVCTVIGFPLGASTSAVKAFETKMQLKMVQKKSIW